ncbi:lysostaphin resistance A-like protein [uncultured Friedmanniella sp.]|uniref:CPBP family intramembrane glutamic endopeptidase n=1 Tax=uncultured Friedmanniella sp. TaxID=335381 RepID=UPI0035CAB004
MSETYGRPPGDAPDHPEPDPRLAGYPPPPLPGPMAQNSPQPATLPPYGWTPSPRPPALPTEPQRYPQLLRGPRRRWWKPLLAALLALGLYVVASFLTLVPPVVVGLATGQSNLVSYVITTITDTAHLGPVGFVALNLSLILLIPTTTLSIWIVYGVRPRFVAAVTGGLRWRWLLRCLAITVPVWLLYVGLGVLTDPPEPGRPAHWVALLLIMVVMTPLQAAGEEYFFRGFILLNVGSWFARPVVGLVVGTTVSAVLFAAAHGSPDIWVLGSIACLAVASCLAAWRTGGLEAGIAMHATNNVLVFVVSIGIGGWQTAFVGSDTKGTPGEFGLALAVHGVALALIWWQAKRSGLANRSRPAARPAPMPGWPPVGPRPPGPEPR